jgi:hypothetical protein
MCSTSETATNRNTSNPTERSFGFAGLGLAVVWLKQPMARWREQHGYEPDGSLRFGVCLGRATDLRQQLSAL